MRRLRIKDSYIDKYKKDTIRNIKSILNSIFVIISSLIIFIPGMILYLPLILYINGKAKQEKKRAYLNSTVKWKGNDVI